MRKISMLFGIILSFVMILASVSVNAQTPTPSPTVSPNPSIKVVKDANPVSLPPAGGNVTYTYTVTNLGNGPLTSVTVSDTKCSNITLVSGDTNQNNNLDQAETWKYQCKVFLSQTTTNLVTVHGITGGVGSTDMASATVTVGATGKGGTPSAMPKTGGGGVGVLNDLAGSFTTGTGLLGLASAAFYLRYRRK